MSLFYPAKRGMLVAFFISFFFLLQSLSAQTGSISGKVLDRATGEPLLGANVIVEGTNLGAATDPDGQFIIRRVPVGEHNVRISYIGYNPITVTVDVQENRTLEDEYLMDPNVVEGETVTITAQAEGQLSAINQQLTSNTIANVVSRSRIQELPDVNAAESIGRLPGVSINRSGGEATKIAIRGLSPKYNLVTVNGVRIPSTGGDDRSVDLSLISSNMLDGIVLKKALTPDMDADALGGSVDLRLREAPEDFQFNISAQGGYNQLQDYYGNYNFAGNVSNRFMDNKLGIMASFNIDEYDRSADKFSGEYRETNSGTDIYTGRVVLREENVTRNRAGGSFLLDYKIPDGKITANSFYSYLSWDGLNRVNNMTLTSPGESNRHYYNTEVRGGNTSIFTGAFSIEQDIDWVKYDFGIARTTSNTEAPGERTWRFTQEGGAFSDTEPDPGTPPQEVAGYATPDTFKTFLSEVWIDDTEREENESSLTLNFEFPLSISNDISGSIKTGGKFRWLDRRNDVERQGRHGIHYGGSGNSMIRAINQANPDWNLDPLLDSYIYIPISPFLTDYSRPDFLDGEYPLGYTTNLSMLNRVTEVLSDSGEILRYSIPSLGNDYNGVERYQAGYVMGEFKLGKIFTFIPGIRYEQEYTKYNGWRFRETTPNNMQGDPGELEELESVRSHDFWLPMFHLIAEPTNWMKIRLARTKSLSRPDYILIMPMTRINSGQDYIVANNAKLRPSQSVNYDATISFYENYLGLLSISGFYKEVEDLIFQTNYRLRQGIEVPEGAFIPEHWRNSAPSTDLFINNPEPAFYKGFEIEWQTHFWYLPSYLNGLVLNVNYTRIYSEIEKWVPNVQQDTLINPPPFVVWSYKVLDSSRTTRMPDQPKHILNITLGYDIGGFSARLSYLYQTDKFISIGNKPILDSFTGEYSRWDLTLQQKLGMGIQVFANLTNLNNRPDENFSGDRYRSPTYTEYYGFTMDLGVRYNFR